MDITPLMAIGLSDVQATAYAVLIEHGEIAPTAAAKKLQTTRTNAYKILDKLVELGLAERHEQNKKLVYKPTSPIAITSLVSEYRAEATAREEAASAVMHELLAKYHQHSDRPDVLVSTGRKEVADAYRRQLALREDVYFIRTQADISMMGFDTMHEIRVTPSRHGKQRYGILTAPENGPVNNAQHQRSNLEVTWAKKGLYSAPVEWSVTDSSLLIVLYATEPHSILITDPLVALAFKQIWQLLNTFLQSEQTHQTIEQR